MSEDEYRALTDKLINNLEELLLKKPLAASK